MKKLLLFVFMIFAINHFVNAQVALGIQYSYNTTWLMNKQVFDEGPEMDVKVSFGDYYGFMCAYYFSDNFGLEANVNVNSINQKYNGYIKYALIDSSNFYNSSIKYKSVDIPIILKFGKKTYFELGGLIQIVNKITYTRNFDGTFGVGQYKGLPYAFSNEQNVGVLNKFNKNGYGVIFGFGTNFNLVDNVLFLNLGFRVNYVISNMKGINALGLDKESSYVTEEEKPNLKNNPLYGGLRLGLVYIFE